MQETASMFMTLGALAGLLTRQPLTAALNNMSAAMQGVQEKDQQQFDENYKQFQDNYKRAMDRNKEYLEERRSIIDDRKTSLSEKIQLLNLASAKAGDKVGQLAKTWEQQNQLFHSQLQATQHTEDKAQQLQFHVDQMVNERKRIALESQRVGIEAQKLKLAQQNSPSNASISPGAVGMAKTGMPLNQIVPGYGKEAAAARAKLRDEAIKGLKADHPELSDEEAGKQLAKLTIEYQSGKQSNAQLTKTLGSLRPALDQLKFNADKVDEEMAKLGSTDLSPVINAIMRKEEQWTGEPAMAGLFYFMNAAAMESARIQSGGTASVAQLHEGAAAEARKFANTDMTPASWKEVKAGMLAEGDNRLKNYEDALGANEKAFQPKPAAGGGWTPEKEKRLQELRAKAGNATQ